VDFRLSVDRALELKFAANLRHEFSQAQFGKVFYRTSSMGILKIRAKIDKPAATFRFILSEEIDRSLFKR